MQEQTDEQLTKKNISKVYRMVNNELWNLSTALYQLQSLDRYDTTVHVLLDDISHTALRLSQEADNALAVFQDWKAEQLRTDTSEVEAISAREYAVKLQKRVSGKLGE